MFDTDTGQDLSRSECFELLRQHSLGRIIYSDQALPTVEPVNYAVHHHSVVLLTRASSKLAVAIHNVVVGFEADRIANDLQTGWGIRAVGLAHPVDNPDVIHELTTLPLRSWNTDGQQLYIQIPLDIIQGRHITPAQPRQTTTRHAPGEASCGI